MIKKNEATHILFRLHKDDHQDFFNTCHRKRVSMGYVLREAVKYYIEINKARKNEEKPTESDNNEKTIN